MTYKCFKKKISGGGIKNENMSDQPLVEELHKRIIRKCKNEKVHSTFIVAIWAADLADVQLISEYARVFPLKDKKGIAITITVFQKQLNECNCKPSKIWVDKGSEFYKRLMKSWLNKNDIEMYSTHNEGKSIVDESKRICSKLV